MRRYIRAFLVCTVLAVLSVLYVYSKLFYSTQLDGGGVGRMTFLSPAASQRRAIGQGTKLVIDRKGPDSQHWNNRNIMRQRVESNPSPAPIMHLGVVACGQRLEETLTMVKSAVLLSSKLLLLHLFSEELLHSSFTQAMESWPGHVRSRFSYRLYPITLPQEHAAEWRKLFKPCASQRLFLPLILKDVDSLLYVDSDVVFLEPVDALWVFLTAFNSTQLVAMAPEHEEPRIAWYNRFARHPYYGRTGINSGVMLMNMTRIRSTYFKNDMTSIGLRWEELLRPLLQKYKLNITWGDQDLLNIIFHHNPECLLEVSCQWNYRPDHCIYGSNCVSAEEAGVCILHGNRGVYHDHKQPAFRAVYDAIKQYSFDADPVSSLLRPLEAALQNTTHTYCGKAHHQLTKRLAVSLTSTHRD
ncbi:glucoside xylosyltransferase 1-like [Hypomesus transpacificus]|uniref:glucoside xylosyltransferase 1-like n=1 Tax=Hypomesus transpacificus TaxID=137520 RepID=UPI001F082002|nr:glucoside xylosyltransferase 1-like [Hypomesus transpacificus]